jgi:hypothetical protein
MVVRMEMHAARASSDRSASLGGKLVGRPRRRGMLAIAVQRRVHPDF